MNNNNESPFTKKDLLEALGAIEQRLDSRLSSIERSLESFGHRIGGLEKFVDNTTRRLAELESPDRLFDLMLRVAEIERRLYRPQ
jgi:hypothetical protein